MSQLRAAHVPPSSLFGREWAAEKVSLVFGSGHLIARQLNSAQQWCRADEFVWCLQHAPDVSRRDAVQSVAAAAALQCSSV